MTKAASKAMQRFSGDPKEREIAMATFLVIYAQGRSITYAAGQAGVSRITIWTWRQKYTDFNEAFVAAQEEGTDTYEDRLYELAIEDGNVSAVIFGLRMRGRAPAVARVSGEGDDGAPSDTNIEELADNALQRGYVVPTKAVEAKEA